MIQETDLNMKYFQILSLFFASCFYLACKPAAPSENETAAASSAAVPVRVVHPQHRNFDSNIRISGQAMPNRQITVYALENGFVTALAKDIGDRVGKGETILKLDNPELRELHTQKKAELGRAEAGLKQANARLAKARAVAEAEENNANRLKAVFANTPDLTPAAEMDRANAKAMASKADVDLAEADVLAAQKEIETVKAQLQGIQTRLEMLNVKAPFSGIVSQRFVDLGTSVRSGLSNSNPQALVELIDINPLRISIPLPEADVANVQVGTAVTVQFPNLPGKNFQARVSRMAQAIDPETGNMKIEIDLPNSEGKIKAGMYAQVIIALQSREGVLSLPVQTRFMEDDVPVIYQVKGQLAQKLVAKTGLSNKDFFEVLNDGINEQSIIIMQGKSMVRDGSPVDPVESEN